MNNYFSTMIIKKLFVIVVLIFSQNLMAQNYQNLDLLDSSRFINPKGIALSKISFRGLCVVNDKVIWVSGSKGTFAKSVNGGLSFSISTIPGFEKTDFRDIEAFNEDVAVVMGSGSPSYILKTFDGGTTWKKVFEDERKEMFLDAMDFWDENKGMVIGDPIDERFVLYKTIDGGNTRHSIDTSMRPWAVKGESLFAASGTCFRCMPKNSIAFVTGGTSSNFHWLQIDKKYQSFELKFMTQGKPSQGAFSFTFNKKYIIVVGGDYANDTAKVQQGCYSYTYSKNGLELLNQKPFYSNYRSAVELIDNDNFITCGTKGVDLIKVHQTTTSSNKKSKISDVSFNVVGKAKKGILVALAGSQGKIAILK
jgi:photosystem II stability/assembly factor-like uncharacterized protein